MGILQTIKRQAKGEEVILNQGKLAGGLADELLEVIRKYDETIYMSTAIGVLELVKQQLISENVESDEDDK
jgi:hypothetical protein